MADQKLEERGADVIRVGLTQAHGMASEQSQFPPPGVRYSFPRSCPESFRFIRSPLKGFLRRFEPGEYDLIEAVLSPIYTSCRWVYSLDCFQAALAFDFLGCPLPRAARLAFIRRLLSRDNFKQLIFWSHAAQETLHSYGGIKDTEFAGKASVVYPAMREAPDDLIQFHGGQVNLLFSGDFFRKGGVNVIDAFERAQKQYPGIKLRVCCDERIDFNTRNIALREQYLYKIRSNSSITFGRVARDDLVQNILPKTDVYLMPTYTEAFGFALLEAMAFGIPVISTNHFAIPELVEHEVCGYLIDTKKFDCENWFKGYVVNDIPPDFREYVTDNVYRYLCRLIESAELRRTLGTAGVRIARTKFSFETRNQKMLAIYRDAMR